MVTAGIRWGDLDEPRHNIDNPGNAAINAALRPAHGNFLFFLTTNSATGATLFFSTATAFNNAVAKYGSTGGTGSRTGSGWVFATLFLIQVRSEAVVIDDLNLYQTQSHSGSQFHPLQRRHGSKNLTSTFGGWRSIPLSYLHLFAYAVLTQILRWS